ncbi:MAG TPA: protein kinase [Geothrix sp.]|nr:protein kinase [Geothrix sp.]
MAPGTEIGRFQVQALLGQGGMGAVYLAWDPVLERRVALKSIRLGGDEKAGSRERFRREAMALAQLNHRHVCQVHDWVEHEGNAYIAMENIEGETLSKAGKQMDFRQKLQAIRAIAYALEAAHAKGIVHRDLKSSNVMVDAEGQVKVLDFGLARLMDSVQLQGEHPTGSTPIFSFLAEASDEDRTLVNSLALVRDDETHAGSAHPSTPSSSPSMWGEMTEVGLFIGSPAYASPEQMCGKRVGPPSDVFSLGVVAWELLLGDHPFPGEGQKRMTATIQGELKSLRGRRLPRRVANLLRAMLHANASKRPTARQVADTLSSQLKRTPLIWWAGGATAALICLLSLGYFFFGRSIIADLSKERPPRMAVLPLRNETGEAKLDAMVSLGMAELLASSLRSSPSLTVVEPESVTRAITGLRMTTAEAAEPAGQIRIAKALGAKLFLRGSLVQDPTRSERVLRYDLVDSSGNTRVSGSVQAPREANFNPYALVDPATHDLLRKVDPLRAGASQSAPVPQDVFAIYANAKAQMNKGDFKGSESQLREAALKAPAFSSAVLAYASCLRRLGRDQVLPVANWALMAAKATGDRLTEGRVLGLKAFLAKDQGDLGEAQRLREVSLKLAQTIGDRDGETIALNHLGLIAHERGQDVEANGFYQRSLEISRQVGEQVNLSLAQNNLANLALNRGDMAAAGTLYQSSLNLQRDMGNRWGEAIALNNLGVLALMTRDLGNAEGLLTKALAIRETVGDTEGQVTCLRNLGILELMKGQIARSTEFHGRALDLAKKTGLRTIEAECQFYVAELHRLQGQFPEAREDYQRVLALLPEGVTPGVRGNAQAALAECRVRMPRPELKEGEKLLMALQGKNADSPFVHRAKAWLAFQSDRPTEALAELDLALADPRREAPELKAELEQTKARFLASTIR